MTQYRDTYALIHLDYLEDNVNALYHKVQKPMMAIIKANAYGHGYQQVASVLKDNPVIAMFGVATLKEAIDLRKAGIDKDILVLGAIPLEDLDMVIDYDITLTLYSHEYMQEIINSGEILNKVKKLFIFSIFSIKIEENVNSTFIINRMEENGDNKEKQTILAKYYAACRLSIPKCEMDMTKCPVCTNHLAEVIKI